MTEITMTFQDVKAGEILIKQVSFKGQLDETNVDAEAKKVYQVVSEMQPPYLILDFSELDYMNSKSIGYVTDWFSQVSGKGGKLAIYKPKANILDILRVVGITQIVNVYEDMEEIKAEFQKVVTA